MRSTLTKPHSFATVSIGKSACSSVQRAASACTRSVNRAGVSPVSPRKSRAKLRGLMAMRSAKVVHLDRHPRAPESKQLGLPPGRRRKTTIVWAMSNGTEIFFNRSKGKINPALIMRDAAAAPRQRILSKCITSEFGFNNVSEAKAANCPPTVTPFTSNHQAGIQIMNTSNFPDDFGPLRHVQ